MTTAPTLEEIAALEQCVERLEGSGQYRVLRKLPELWVEPRPAAEGERIVAIVDTETTGLDPYQDEVIEIAGIALFYTADGDITGAKSSYSQLREPRIQLSREIEHITGITSSMLKGKTIDKNQLDAFFGEADLIVAHNASFDRPFCEQLSHVFRDKPWACSAREIDWSRLGFDGAKLTYLERFTI